MKNSGLLLLIIICLHSSCGSEGEQGNNITEPPSAPLINYAVSNRFLHDTTAYTEGFLVHEGQLFESTGASPGMAQTKSLFGITNLQTGRIDTKAELDGKKYFGEGIVILKDKIYQLTYQNRVGFIYDANTFKPLGQFSFPSAEGWGLTTDGQSLIMSDGTAQLTWLDPVSFKPVKTVQVTNEKGPLVYLNELEFIGGFIYANVFTTSKIVKIDPSTGTVVAQLDLVSLVKEAEQQYEGSMELNGIAYDSSSRKVFVTGKMWPTIYEISFAH